MGALHPRRLHTRVMSVERWIGLRRELEEGLRGRHTLLSVETT